VGRERESRVEEERTRERKEAACLVELETGLLLPLSLSSVRNGKKKQKKVKQEKFRGVWGRN
jgi:hypothetical protein